MEHDNIKEEIYGYKKIDSKIEVYTNDTKTIKVFNTEKNEKKLLEQIKKNREKMISRYDSNDKFVQITNQVTALTGIMAILISLGMITSAYNGNFETSVAIDGYISLLLDSPFFILGSLIYKEDKDEKKLVEKYEFFFENEEKINKAIKKNRELLSSINTTARKRLEENSSSSIPPLNVNTVRWIKLKELKKLLEKAKLTGLEEELDLETPEDIINDGLDELKEQYDSLEIEKTKKTRHLFKKMN